MELNPAPEVEAAAFNVITSEFDPQRNRADASQIMRRHGGWWGVWMGVLSLGADCNHTGSKIEAGKNYLTQQRRSTHDLKYQFY